MKRFTIVALAGCLALGACADDGGDADDLEFDDDDNTAVIVTTIADDPSDSTAATTAPDTPGTEPSDPPATPATPAPTTAATAPPSTAVASVAENPQVEFVEVAEVDAPLDLAWRDGDPTLYVAGQEGTVTAIDPATGATRPVLDITDLTSASGEQGLLGLVFNPAGDRAYVNYSDDSGDTVIAEFSVAADGTFDPGSRRILLQVDQPYGNHNGGDLEFGPDGMLYIGLGDGGSGGDPERRALNVNTLLGKLLRIDPAPSGGLEYTIPDDNPYLGVEGARPELFAIGLRNPWKFTWDPSTGDLWIADVGQNDREEINWVPAPADGTVAGRGLSFGWSAFEGTMRFNEDQPAEGHVAPVLEYPHTNDNRSISGGAVYRGSTVAAIGGGYVYGDFGSGRVWVFDRVNGRNHPLGDLGAVSGVISGPDRELYVLSFRNVVLRIAPAG